MLYKMLKERKLANSELNNASVGLTGCFEDKGNRICFILGFYCDDIVIGGAFEDFGHAVTRQRQRRNEHGKTFSKSRPSSPFPPGQVHAHGKIPVASEFVESVTTQVQGNQTDVRVVHSLKTDAGRRAVPRPFIDKVFDGL